LVADNKVHPPFTQQIHQLMLVIEHDAVTINKGWFVGMLDATTLIPSNTLTLHPQPAMDQPGCQLHHQRVSQQLLLNSLHQKHQPAIMTTGQASHSLNKQMHQR
jgi:hypothetical protein